MKKYWPELIALVFVNASLILLELTLHKHPGVSIHAVGKSQALTPPEFAKIHDTNERKQKFIRYFATLAQQANQEIFVERQRLLALFEHWRQHTTLSHQQMNAFCKLAKKYKVDCSTDDLTWKKLLRRIDTVPVSLIIAQAAIESAWGTSRFARDANNYFGIWCYQPGCGLPPRKRAPNARHFVRRYSTPLDSVRGYLYNLNVGHAYTLLRQVRAKLRAQNRPVTGIALAEGLIRYSARGRDYIAEIELVIRHNRLDQYDHSQPALQ
ncbi:MAG: hypothetical protein D6694_05755 [Gammaproteobacteria bacterium]|nr:MAG: hypothetical protein D6694_05755 [Gammaproteobacteria bacterium]